MADTPRPVALHSALIRNTGVLISRMGLVAQRHFAERIAAVGLTPREWGVLNVLDHEGPIAQHALGKCIGMDPSTTVSTLDQLEAKGLVERRRNPQDRRAHALYVTDEGRRVLSEGRRVARGAQEELLAPLDADERKQLHDLLLRLAAQSETQATIATSPERAARG